MLNIDKVVTKRLNRIIFAFIFNGLLLILLGFFIVKFPLVLRLVAALVTIVIAYVFLYFGISVYFLKKDFKDHFKI
jgi:hypothetical protein